MHRGIRIFLPILIALFSMIHVAHGLDVAQVTEGCIPLVVLAKADFDGDGQNDTLFGAATSSPHGYRSLLVTSSDRRTLLDITDGRHYYIIQVADIGAPNPIIIAGTPFGSKWSNLEAWMYLPDKGFQQLWWDSSFTVVGLIEGINTRQRKIQLITPEGKKTYRYSNGSLRSDSSPR
ncbi:MAG TPA: hypothetical protein VK464_11820 [Symbiobacteriaceae bacterium]|jgi:hypothetical protein|nr:hypothetical protein [Symbiobacteriaceae bacterium]